MSSLARFRTRPNGQRVEVEEVDLGIPAGKPRKAKRPEFAAVELDWVADMAEAAGCPCAVILIVMRYLAWKAGSQTFAFSNTLLTRLGIDRRTKYWVLESLEAAGKVKVEHPGSGRAPIVTLVTPSRGVA